MKKKLMMVAVLLGALSLGACVENNESASVEAVRGAKAEQLKSIAVLNNANAEATLILAKAEAAIKEATAEGLKIANELKGIKLEIAKAGLTAKLEAAKANAEADLETAKARLLEAQATLIGAMDNVSIAEKARIQKLLAAANLVLDGGEVRNGNTTTIIAGLNKNRQDLIDAKFAKAGLEAGLDGVKASQEKTIILQKREIAKSEALLAEYEKYSQTTKDEALKAANEARVKEKGLQAVYMAALNSSNSAQTTVRTASENVRNSAYLANASYQKSEWIDGYTLNFAHADGTNGSVYVDGYFKQTADTEAMSAEVTRYTRELAVVNATLKEANAALTEKKKSESYKASEKAVVDATKAYNEADTAAKKEQAKNALNQAENDLKYAAFTEEMAVKDATDRVKSLEKSLKMATDKLAAVSGENATAYAALVKAWEDAMKASTAAQIEYLKADHNYTVQRTLVNSLEGIANNLADYAMLVLGEKADIANANKAIAEAKEVSTKEEAIAKEARNIAKLEQQIKIDEATYADYMAQIEALIKAAN